MNGKQQPYPGRSDNELAEIEANIKAVTIAGTKKTAMGIIRSQQRSVVGVTRSQKKNWKHSRTLKDQMIKMRESVKFDRWC